MVFKPSCIPSGMSMQQYAELSELSQIMATPLELPPTVRKKKFLRDNEIKFLVYLRRWCANYLVFSQVHLLQMIEMVQADIDSTFMANYKYLLGPDTPENRKKAHWKVFNMVNLLSVDFVLADLMGNPIYALELNGDEHDSDTKLIERDKIKAHVLTSIGVPLLTIRNVELNQLGTLQRKIEDFVK